MSPPTREILPAALAAAWSSDSVPPAGLIALAAGGRRRAFAAGRTLVRQGDSGRNVHIILDGHVRVERAHPLLVRPVVVVELGPGDVVGEVGAPAGRPGPARPCTATAVEPTETLELSPEVLARALQQFPEVGAALLTRLNLSSWVRLAAAYSSRRGRDGRRDPDPEGLPLERRARSAPAQERRSRANPADPGVTREYLTGALGAAVERARGRTGAPHRPARKTHRPTGAARRARMGRTGTHGMEV